MKSFVIILKSTFKSLTINSSSLLKALFVPFTLIIIFDYYSHQEKELLRQVLGSMTSAIAYLYLAIITHRVIILGAESVPKYGLYKPTSRELIFARHFIGLSLLLVPFFLIAALPFLQFELFSLLIVTFVMYVISRVSIVFPAIACDINWSYTDAWYVTKNYKVLVVITVGLFPSILYACLALINITFNHLLFSTILSALSTIITVSVLSSTYQYIEKIEKQTHRKNS